VTLSIFLLHVSALKKCHVPLISPYFWSAVTSGCRLVPCRADEFEDELNDPTSLCWHVIHTGQKLYERAA
jgi:hypothetical protein